MLLPGTSKFGDIFRNTHGPESYFTTRYLPLLYQSQAAELCTQTDLGSDGHNDGIEQPMEVSKGVPSQYGLHSPLVNELNHVGATPVKEAMMHGIEETLAVALELWF